MLDTIQQLQDTLLFLLETKLCYVVLAGLELTKCATQAGLTFAVIFLSQPPQHWDDRHVSPCLVRTEPYEMNVPHITGFYRKPGNKNMTLQVMVL